MLLRRRLRSLLTHPRMRGHLSQPTSRILPSTFFDSAESCASSPSFPSSRPHTSTSNPHPHPRSRTGPTTSRAVTTPTRTSSNPHPHVHHPSAPPAGQPLPSTHPHLLDPDEVNPGLTAAAFYHRRSQLALRMGYRELAIVASAPTTYMAGIIPYPYRPGTDLRYVWILEVVPWQRSRRSRPDPNNNNNKRRRRDKNKGRRLSCF